MKHSKHIEHIRALEKKLNTSKDFGQVADYFLTHLGEDKSFLDACVNFQGKNELLFDIVGITAAEVLPDLKPPLTMAPFLSKFPNSDFIHGLIMIKEHVISVIFFEESKIGLVVFSLGNDLMHFCRITGLTMHEGKVGKVHGIG